MSETPFQAMTEPHPGNRTATPHALDIQERECRGATPSSKDHGVTWPAGYQQILATYGPII